MPCALSQQTLQSENSAVVNLPPFAQIPAAPAVVVSFAQAQATAPAPPCECVPQFSSEELRLLLSQLFELQASREKNLTYEDFIKKLEDQFQKETANWKAQLDNQKALTLLSEQKNENTQKKLDTANEKAKFWEDAYRTVTKKPGFWCAVKKFFSFGLAKCI